MVTHPSITQSRPCLTLEIRRDPVFTQWYGRRQKLVLFSRSANLCATEKNTTGRRQNVQKYTAPGLPKWSPTLVLPRPDHAEHCRSDEIQCSHSGMVVDKSWSYSHVLLTFTLLRKIQQVGDKTCKSPQHLDFPSGHPPQYYPGPNMLNIGDQTKSSVLTVVWS